jgi:hypothetical protein
MPKHTKSQSKTAAAKIRAAAVALGRLGGLRRAQTTTPEQRSAQGRMAVASRRDRQPKGPWFGLVVLPVGYKWKGTRHASAVLDEAHANTAEVLFWSQDRAEVKARSQQEDLRDRITLIVSQEWNPCAFTIQREFKPDAGAQVAALRSLVDDERGKP